MEAKDWEDTVMSKESIEEVKYLEICDNPEYHDLRLSEKRDVEDKAIAKAQAKSSFPLGEKQGMGKVVEWVEENTEHINPSGVRLDRQDWQAKLKEWGIEK